MVLAAIAMEIHFMATMGTAHTLTEIQYMVMTDIVHIRMVIQYTGMMVLAAIAMEIHSMVMTDLAFIAMVILFIPGKSRLGLFACKESWMVYRGEYTSNLYFS